MANMKADGWVNVLTGLGIKGRDKNAGTEAKWLPMAQREIENLKDASSMAKKIISLPLRDAFKKDAVFSAEGVAEDFNEELWKFLKKNKRHENFIKAAAWGRTYGSAYLVLGILDGKEPNEPVDYNNISSVAWTQVLHKYELAPMEIDWDISSPTFRRPLTYQYSLAGMSSSKATGPIIHRSRVIEFSGAKLCDYNYQRNNYSDDSILNDLKDDIRNYEAAFASTATLLNHHASGIFKMKGLAGLIAGGMDESVITRLSLVDTTRSNVKSIVVDSEEDFEFKGASLAGIAENLRKFEDKLVASSGIPHTLLLGEGSSGTLSGEGSNELKQWQDRIAGEQRKEWKPLYMEYLDVLLAAKDNPVTSGNIPDGLNMKFPPIVEMDSKEKADVYRTTAEADRIYLDAQVLSPDEVAKRFKDEGFDQDLEIDLDLRTQDFTDYTDPANQTDLTANLPPEE